jgi:hypothetical protein
MNSHHSYAMLVAAVAAAGCSGADASPILDLTAEARTIPSSDAGAQTVGDAGSKQGDAARVAPAGDRTPDAQAEAGPDLPAPAPAPVPTAPAPATTTLPVGADGCSTEIESNNSAAAPNRMQGSRVAFCGALADSSDQDFVAWVMPAAATRLLVSIDADDSVEGEIRVSDGGGTFFAGENPIVRPGATYLVRVTGGRRFPSTYRVDLVSN